jgi:hypothetical protein
MRDARRRPHSAHWNQVPNRTDTSYMYSSYPFIGLILSTRAECSGRGDAPHLERDKKRGGRFLVALVKAGGA